jgi:hypothetical protein
MRYKSVNENMTLFEFLSPAAFADRRLLFLLILNSFLGYLPVPDVVSWLLVPCRKGILDWRFILLFRYDRLSYTGISFLEVMKTVKK